MTPDYGDRGVPHDPGAPWDSRPAPADRPHHGDAFGQRPPQRSAPQRSAPQRAGGPVPAPGYTAPPRTGHPHQPADFRMPQQRQPHAEPQHGGGRSAPASPAPGVYGGAPPTSPAPGVYGGSTPTSGAPGVYGGSTPFTPGPVTPLPGAGRAGSTAPRPAPAATPARRRSRAPLVLTIVFLLLAAGGGGAWWYLRGNGDDAPTAQELRVADRRADPRPLTVAEVFPPAAALGGASTYKLLKTQQSTDCGTAAAGAVTQHLTAAGCTQVVRATMASSDGAVVVTAGIFNLESHDKALQAASDIKTAVDEGTGRFAGLAAGDESDIISRAAANLAWDVRGHYLVYSLTAKPDGSAIADDDPHTDDVRRDVVKKYLGDTVIGKRESSGQPTP